MSPRYDFVVVGAGVFGAWTAHHLRRSGASVALLDAYGPANSRASSAGETRVIRMSYGPDELYTRWSLRSLALWREFFGNLKQELFHRTGVLWLSHATDAYTQQELAVLDKVGVAYEKLTGDDVRRRWPQLRFDDVTWAVFEPESGALMARRSVQALVASLVTAGADYLPAAVLPPRGTRRLTEVQTAAGESLSAGAFVFACGSWLPKLFPDVLAGRIVATRQEVFFLGTPAGSDDFRAPRMPVWVHHTHPDRPYALPDIEARGFKLAFDRHGPEFDPDEGTRVVGPEPVALLRRYLERHIPALHKAPLVETRVCQYENTWNGDFLIDRHPDLENVWLVGGGSGHGFKHGPAVGEYAAARILHDAPAAPRFSLAGKQTGKERAVY